MIKLPQKEQLTAENIELFYYQIIDSYKDYEGDKVTYFKFQKWDIILIYSEFYQENFMMFIDRKISLENLKNVLETNYETVKKELENINFFFTTVFKIDDYLEEMNQSNPQEKTMSPYVEVMAALIN